MLKVQFKISHKATSSQQKECETIKIINLRTSDKKRQYGFYNQLYVDKKAALNRSRQRR